MKKDSPKVKVSRGTKFKKVKEDSEIPKLAKKIILRFKEELGHINPDDVQFSWRISKNSRYHGKTMLIRGALTMLTDKKVVMVLWLRSWKQHDKAWRMLLLYHELKHIFPPKKDGSEYRLLRHDVEDFAELITKYGVRWEKASKFLDYFK